MRQRIFEVYGDERIWMNGKIVSIDDSELEKREDFDRGA